MTVYTITLSNDEKDWKYVWTSSVNPAEATWMGCNSTPQGLHIQLGSKVNYGGGLYKNVVPLIVPASSITFAYTVMVDPSTASSGQVIETDMKMTDAAGWTYDGSAQWNIAQGWKFQVGDPWQDTGVKVNPFPPGEPVFVSIAYALDYSIHTITIVSVTVDSKTYPVNKTIAARKVNWSPSEIVTQMQLCNNGQPGGYSVCFVPDSIRYTLK